jgi:hypothetical protein
MEAGWWGGWLLIFEGIAAAAIGLHFVATWHRVTMSELRGARLASTALVVIGVICALMALGAWPRVPGFVGKYGLVIATVSPIAVFVGASNLRKARRLLSNAAAPPTHVPSDGLHRTGEAKPSKRGVLRRTWIPVTMLALIVGGLFILGETQRNSPTLTAPSSLSPIAPSLTPLQVWAIAYAAPLSAGTHTLLAEMAKAGRDGQRFDQPALTRDCANVAATSRSMQTIPAVPNHSAAALLATALAHLVSGGQVCQAAVRTMSPSIIEEAKNRLLLGLTELHDADSTVDRLLALARQHP